MVALLSLHSSRSVFDSFLSKILHALDQPSSPLRSRALRTLNQIIKVDTSLLALDFVRNAVEQRILDPAASVRESAIDLVSTCAFSSKDIDLIRGYFDVISDRASDTATSVRKRALRFLKDAFFRFPRSQQGGTDDMERLVVACSVFITRANGDEETTVNDLATSFLQECWLSQFTEPSLVAISKMAQGTDGSSLPALQSLPPIARKVLDDRLKTIVATTRHCREPDLIGDAFKRMLLKDRDSKVRILQVIVLGLVEQGTVGRNVSCCLPASSCLC